MRKLFNQGFSAGILIAVLLIVGVLGALGYAYWNNINNSTSSSDQTTSVNNSSDAIGNIKSTIKTSWPLVEFSGDIQANWQDNFTVPKGKVYQAISKVSPSWKIDGYDFYTYGSIGDGLYLYIQEDDAIALNEKIIGALQDSGLSKVSSYNSYSSVAYKNDSIVCATNNLDNGVPIPLSVLCASIVDYEGLFSEIKPFADAYIASGVGVDDVTIGDLDIEDSSMSGYKKATTSVGELSSIGGAQAQFYKAGEGNWKFFRSGQDIADCSEYNTTDLKNAFKGDTCLVGSSVSKV